MNYFEVEMGTYPYKFYTTDNYRVVQTLTCREKIKAKERWLGICRWRWRRRCWRLLTWRGPPLNAATTIITRRRRRRKWRKEEIWILRPYGPKMNGFANCSRIIWISSNRYPVHLPYCMIVHLMYVILFLFIFPFWSLYLGKFIMFCPILIQLQLHDRLLDAVSSESFLNELASLRQKSTCSFPFDDPSGFPSRHTLKNVTFFPFGISGRYL